MKVFTRSHTKDELKQRIGDISQVAGIKSYSLKEGRMQGMDALDIKTGSGLSFTVLPDRAMDVAWMEFKGQALGYISKGGLTHSKYYQPNGYEWLRGFYGGLLTTCGLTHVGPPEKEGIWELGLHGRISNTPATEVCHKTLWQGDDLHLVVEGKVKEAALSHENLSLHRKITACGGESKILIEDEVENEGYQDTPFMILYHINIGYPAMSEESTLEAPILHTKARDSDAQAGLDTCKTFQAPTPDYREQVFFHKLMADEDGYTCAGIINEALNLGFYMRYRQQDLPYFTQWKMMGQQDYVVGLEPGNCVPLGRKAARDSGELITLKPGEKKSIQLELGVLSTWEEIQGYKDYISKILKGKSK